METSKIENFWPKNIIASLENQNLPFSILEQQAKYFNELYGKVLHAKVVSRKIDISTENATKIKANLVHSLRIIAPKMDNYYFDIVKLIQSDISAYPIKIDSPFLDTENKRSDRLKITNKKELENILKDIFNDSQTIEVLSNLIKQSNSKD